MQFVNAPNLVPQKDPREDIVLTNVTADLTSGGLVQQRIGGEKAIYSEAAQDLTIKNISVTAYGSDNTTRSITRAELGEIFFADDPERSVGRRDMRFAGDVLYRTPQAADQTTDSMRLTSQLIIWDESEQKFKSPEGYQMLLLPKGQAPVRQSGKGFEATQDLTRFVVKTGVVTTDLKGDPEALRRNLEEQFEVWRAEVDKSRGTGFVKPTPIPLPQRD
jgi:hypothetical protein